MTSLEWIVTISRFFVISGVYVLKEWKWNINLKDQLWRFPSGFALGKFLGSQEISRASGWISQYPPRFGGAWIESIIRQTISYTSDYLHSLSYLPKLISLQLDNTHQPILLWYHLFKQHNSSLISNVARRSFANLQSVRLHLRHCCTRVRFILFSMTKVLSFDKALSGCLSQS